ncbi:peptidoglycan editing factor PgeF [Sporosarcina sp. ACRSL]|uniref:peptidoglycan editing factor PgeF n=1 Tax=Sporosarcina sp. ACRSL TaxID=2918215 RepID=UPI001EF4FED1|nr:peptidoglycan editing factor PgeF [Sporosarcina sp. ACRSL]MCG7343371.1 peptidoglycan editing factor PgeF [Sporosarcina sp. ACRSL]
MKTKIYIDNKRFIAGTTLKDERLPEHNNMAFHASLNPESVLENRKRLAASLQCKLQDFVSASQTHSTNFHKVTLSDKGRGAEVGATAIPNTDALYTTEPNILLCSFTADCVPVIFWNEVNGLIGVIHSGWKGTVQEITLNVFEHLKTAEGCKAEDFHVQIGMALSQEKFEVDEDVYVKFKALEYADEFMYFNEPTNKYHIDNQNTVKKQLELAGVPEDRITIDRTCTYISPDGFSYRQDKKTGRHMSFIMRHADE